MASGAHSDADAEQIDVQGHAHSDMLGIPEISWKIMETIDEVLDDLIAKEESGY